MEDNGEGLMFMNRNGRLPRTVKGEFVKRRLDLATEKKELISDILHLGGSAELGALEEELCAFGESLSETLPALSIPRLRRIHQRTVSGDLNIPIVEDVI